MSLAYLFSRYPVVSQTFCDSEMLALEAQGRSVVVASLNPPPNSFRHERLRTLKAEILYPPPAAVLKELPVPAAMTALAGEHDTRYGAGFKAATRARNAAWFARALARRGVRHIHVHFANRATHTALFLKRAGFTFSFTAHAQDYMVDLGSDELLRELAREAEFVIAVSNFSRDDLRRRCPDSTGTIHRIYNGLRLADFPATQPAAQPGPLRLLSIGRLIEFKGFHHLIDAVALLRLRGVDARLEIIGEGPWRERLARQIADQALDDRVRLAGVLGQESIKAALAASDVFALACCVDDKGASDILPTVIMEAMAARLPVVSTRVAGVPEMVIDGVTGLLTPPADPPALADALARLADDPEARAALGAAGRDRCAALFSLDTTAAELGRRFDEVRARDAGGSAAGQPPAAPPSVLILSAAATEPELPSLTAGNEGATAPSMGVLTAGAAGPQAPEWLDFLPDAIVLEASWRAQPADAAVCEALHARLGAADGESFFRDARRAVHTATLVRQRGIRHLHAARADTVVWAWLVKKITGIRASYTVESPPALPRSLLARVLPDFDCGSLADEKLAAATGGRDRDWLGLAPPAKSGLFGARRRPPADLPGFRRLLLGT